jgi:multiple sugar transport system permease protein
MGAAIPAPLARRTGRSPFRRREAVEGVLFAAPFLLGFVLWIAFPMLYSVWLVFQSWDLLTPPTFSGLDNITNLIDDPQVAIMLANSAFYTFIGVPLRLILAFLLAMALNVQLRGRDVYRTIFYLPAITPIIASAVVWLRIFHPEFGILNEVIGVFGIPPQKWLFDPALAKPSFIFMDLWTIGPQFVIFLAGLQSVPETLLEAASIDGAGPIRRFFGIIIPMVSPVIFFNLVVGIIGSFQVFTTALVMTDGGPQNATLFAVLYIYKNGFTYYHMGYAATLAWLLFLIILVFTVVQFFISQRWVFYEEN